tara:strand:+ start:107 stop:304 length:198 start_codon:yes stop_codon:yes gene_type:complete
MRRQHIYRCSSTGAVNNKLKPQCDFEFTFEEGTHHCPLCGAELFRVPVGKSIVELLNEEGKKQNN